jgi:hypothetical protein
MINVRNFKNQKGNSIPNQFIITEQDYYMQLPNKELIFDDVKIFESYKSIIALKGIDKNGNIHIILDIHFWDYSTTTGKYRNLFLNETKKTTLSKIKSGEYTLMDLN